MVSFNIKGIKFRTWLYFLLFTVIILSLLWLLQVVLFKAYYQAMKKAEIERVSDRLVAQYGNDNFKQTVEDTAFTSGIVIMVFTVDPAAKPEDAINIIASGFQPEMGEPQPTYEKFADFFIKLNQSKEDRIVYLSDERKNFGELTYGCTIRTDAQEEVFFYVRASLVPVDSTTSVLANQLIIVTIMCLTLAFGISLFISRRLSKPITMLNESAKQLAAGNYSVKFEASGYSEIDELSDTLNFATSEMKKTDELRKDLIANISHELRTPLTMVKAYAEMIRDISGDNPAKRREHTQVILDEADRLAALVTDILDLSKIQSNTVELSQDSFDLCALVRQVVRHFDGMVEKDGYVFELTLPHNAVVLADYNKIGQVIYNLIGNAVNYTGANKKIRVNITSADKCYRFSVTDEGKGIAPEDLEHIWDRYFRAAESKRTKIGSGIGLSTVKSIMQQHKCRYGVDSKVGEGSTFWVELYKSS